MTEFTITVQCEFDGEILQEVQKFPSIECPNMRQYASEETKDLANDMARMVLTRKMLDGLEPEEV